jgi:hypothetical protein
MNERPGAQADRRLGFAFLLGTWKVRHRFLKSRLVGCTEWTEFDGTCTGHEFMGGQAVVDDNVVDRPEGAYRASSFRLFDPKTGSWSIWWFDGRTPTHVDPPLVGRFENGAGVFLADDTFEGRPIRVRFIWSRTGSESPRWEQAFSENGGTTWETNWVMDFARTRGPPIASLGA